MSAKAVEDWEQTLLSQASPHTVGTLWELPAIGHFLCLAQTVLNLPEIVFFELERCLLMPRCSSLLSKIMSSLLSPWQRRATLHRRPALPYRRWEAELRLRVKGWYRSVGGGRDQPARAEQLGLCHQFFRILGETSPLEEKPFHSLPFCQRVWLLKGLCDNVYETQKDVQDAVLAQPIHECRESILGYDSKDNAYIHFPHFCGADLRIYCQSPSTPPAFPFPSALVKRVDVHTEDSHMLKDMKGYPGSTIHTDTSGDLGKTLKYFLKENGDGQEHEERFKVWPMKKEEERCESSDGDSSDESSRNCRTSRFVSRKHTKRETVESDDRSTTLEEGLSLDSVCPVKEETQNPSLNVGEHTYTGRSPARSADTTYSPSKPSGVKMEGVNLSTGHHQISPCLKCSRTVISLRRGCSCLPSRHAQNSSAEDEVPGRMWSVKEKCKKMRGRGQPRQVENVEAAESALQGIITTIQRKDKRKKHKEGKKVESAKKISEPSVEPSFKLVCTSLQELRELISKIEDELDDLESTKNKLDRWYLRKEAVKDLHSTLIRLLNELSPWEPKLVKAYQRNRLRLKKEFDDFKKHPEYNNFVREECVSSSSSSSEDEDVSLLDYQQGSENELEHVVPRGLWTGASTRNFDTESVGERSPTFVIANHQKHPETVEQLSRVQADGSISTLAPDTGAKSKCEMIQSNMESAAGKPVHALTSKFPVVHPNPGLPKGYTPIPTLLAKSVGNKVTLMKRPVDYSGVNHTDRQSKGCSSSLPTSTAESAKPQAQTSQSLSQPNSLQTEGERANRQTGMVKVAAAPLTPDWDNGSQTLLQSPLQVASNVPEGRDQPVRKGESNSAANSVQSLHDYSKQEKIMQQVVIVPSKHVIPKSKEQQSTGPMYLSTSVPGFTIPDNVQQAAPLKDARPAKSPSLSSPPCHHHRSQNTPGFQVTQPSQLSTSQTIHQNTSSIISTTTLASALPANLPEHKQELKTICIRDSQSILVTTRGGNTGIVKVQTSSAQNALDGLSTGPVITISPQFKAFLVSKSAEASSVSFQKNPSPVATVANVSIAQPQKQIPSVLPSSAVTNTTGPKSFTSVTPGSSVPGSHKPVGSTVTRNIYPPSQTSATHSLLAKSTVDGIAQGEVVGQPGLKRPNTEEQPKVTKFILVNPSSSCGGTVAVPKEASTNPTLGSRVVVLNQPSATESSALVGSVPKQGMTTGLKGQQITTSLASQSPRMGISPSVDSNAPSKGKNITLPTGLQIQLSGMTATIGQTIGALSRCNSNSTSVSISAAGHSPTTTTQSAPFTKSNVTSCLSQLVANATLTRTSQPQSFTIASQLGSSTSNSATPPAASLPTDILTSHSPAQLTSAVQGNPKPISLASLTHQPSDALANETTPMVSPLQKALNKTQSHISSAITKSTQSMSPAVGANNTQQRIVINISKPLAAGTQILLNNTCFVVPPQGLGPGSHVLIISSPSPQKAPNVTVSNIGSATLLQGASQGPRNPQGPILPSLPGVPVVNSTFSACTPAVGPANVQRSALLPPNASLVSAPSSQVCASASPALTGQPRLAKQAAHVSSVITGGIGLGCALTTLRAEGSTTISPGNASASPRLPAPISSLPSPIALPRSLPGTTRDSCIQPPPTPRVTGPSIMHQGLGITSIHKQASSVIHQVFTGSLTPTIQNLPTSTVRPIDSTTDALETAYMVTLSPPPATFQPITLVTQQPIGLTNQALAKPSLQKSHLGMANSVANKLLISPDGAILSSFQCQAKAAEPNVYPKQTALILTPQQFQRRLASAADSKSTK